ncbi:MAG: hypothetical protein AB7K24_21575 [Gemmataceae bacterium]
MGRFLIVMSVLLIAVAVAARGVPGQVDATHTEKPEAPAQPAAKTVLLPPVKTTEAVRVSPPLAAPHWTPANTKKVPSSAAPHRAAAARLVGPPLPANSMGHAQDYSWLAGRLEFLHARQHWTLRYADVDEEDRYGGSVTLIETGSMSRYHSGQQVRITGRLAQPESRQPSPEYRVISIQSGGD